MKMHSKNLISETELKISINPALSKSSGQILSFIQLIILFFIFVSVETSCDNRDDAWIQKNSTIDFQIKRATDSNYINLELTEKFVDSIKLNFKMTYDYTTTQGNQTWISVDSSSQKASILIDSLKRKIEYTPLTEGSNLVILKLTDPFGREKRDTLRFHHYKNLPPVVNFKVIRNVTTPLYCMIDAGESFDGDSKYGGKITAYDFQIVGAVPNSTSVRDTVDKTTYQQVLNSAGSYQIKVRVYDNDNTWSQYKTVTLIFP